MSHDVTRRTFLTASGATVVAVGALGPVGKALASPRFADDRRNPAFGGLNRENFERWLGQRFTVLDDDGEAVELTLCAVIDESHLMGPEQAELGLREPFSVTLDGPLGVLSREGRYRVSHPELGEHVMYIAYQGTTDDAPETLRAVDRNLFGIYFN